MWDITSVCSVLRVGRIAHRFLFLTVLALVIGFINSVMVWFEWSPREHSSHACWNSVARSKKKKVLWGIIFKLESAVFRGDSPAWEMQSVRVIGRLSSAGSSGQQQWGWGKEEGAAAREVESVSVFSACLAHLSLFSHSELAKEGN